jgi:hypothetical protein
LSQSWLDLVFDLEAAYPRAAGGTTKDETLRLSLVRWANNLFKEVERTRRWSLAYGVANIITIPGQAAYPIPAGILAISNVYYLDVAGQPIQLGNYSAMEMRHAFGEGVAAIQAPPTKFSVEGVGLQLFPAPDNAGPTAGNYTLIIEGYQSLTPIVETSGTTVALSNVLTVPSSAYLLSRGVTATGTTGLSVRGAGALGPGSVPDYFFTNWSAVNVGNTVTMTSNAVTAVAALGAQVYFNSANWLIQDFPKVVTFGVLREVATYLKDDYKTWEARFQNEMELMAQFNADRLMTLEQLATAETGQRVNQLRRLDVMLGIEIRGGVV